MPLYDFQCNDCPEVFEDLVRRDPSGSLNPGKCPKCGSLNSTRLIPDHFGFNFSDPVGTDRWNSDDTGHDYRFKSKQKSAASERAAAEAANGGPSPYNHIDDISSGEHFGEIV